MSVALTPHLNFRGEARAALEFYQSVFGGDLVAITYGDMAKVENTADAGEVVWGQMPDDEAERIVWGQVSAGNGFRVMAYDVPPSRPLDRGEDPFFASLRGDSADEIAELWKRLSDGAEIKTPLAPSAFSPLYGMLTDRFGITWVLDVAVPYTPA